jgi:hypothetical protein
MTTAFSISDLHVLVISPVGNCMIYCQTLDVKENTPNALKTALVRL